MVLRARWGTDGRGGLVAEGLVNGVRPSAGNVVVRVWEVVN